MSISPEHKSIHFREVWSDNLDAEFTLIQDVVENYRYVAMDTEYPGVVTRLIGNFKSHSEYNYQNMKVNVNPSNIIQVGLTFSDDQGNLPTCGTDKFCVWQFNFCEFNLDEDVYAKESIKLLSESGIDFEKNKEKGIKANRFIELLMSSGAVLNDNMRWVTFHGGYDIGYLIKLLTGQNLPDKQEVFLEKVKKFFPVHYDVKHLMKFCKGLGSGLDKLAKQLRVERVGTCHQAGSDSLLTSCTFMKLKEEYLKDTHEKHTGVLFGYGNDNGQITQ